MISESCGNSNHASYELVILDNHMPVLSGIETARIIRELQLKGTVSQTLKVALASGDQTTFYSTEN
jgi:CheY-like chemotaxis protein